MLKINILNKKRVSIKIFAIFFHIDFQIITIKTHIFFTKITKLWKSD